MQTTNMKHIKTFEGFLDEAKKGLWANILVDKPGKPMNYIGLDDILIESVNEASQQRFEVGKKYKHSKFGEFEVLELMPGQTTRVQFKKEPKGETSIIAGWGSDGYPVVK